MCEPASRRLLGERLLPARLAVPADGQLFGETLQSFAEHRQRHSQGSACATTVERRFEQPIAIGRRRKMHVQIPRHRHAEDRRQFVGQAKGIGPLGSTQVVKSRQVALGRPQ